MRSLSTSLSLSLRQWFHRNRACLYLQWTWIRSKSSGRTVSFLPIRFEWIKMLCKPTFCGSFDDFDIQLREFSLIFWAPMPLNLSDTQTPFLCRIFFFKKMFQLIFELDFFHRYFFSNFLATHFIKRQKNKHTFWLHCSLQNWEINWDLLQIYCVLSITMPEFITFIFRHNNQSASQIFRIN